VGAVGRRAWDSPRVETVIVIERAGGTNRGMNAAAVLIVDLGISSHASAETFYPHPRFPGKGTRRGQRRGDGLQPVAGGNREIEERPQAARTV